jgi:hypothetical protein
LSLFGDSPHTAPVRVVHKTSTSGSRCAQMAAA